MIGLTHLKHKNNTIRLQTPKIQIYYDFYCT